MEWHVGPLKGKNVINVSRTTRFSHVNEAQAESSSHYSRVTKWLGSASRQHQMQIALNQKVKLVQSLAMQVPRWPSNIFSLRLIWLQTLVVIDSI